MYLKPLTPLLVSLLAGLSVSGAVIAQSSGPAQVQPATAAPAKGPAGQKLDLLGERRLAPVSRAQADKSDKADRRAKTAPLVQLPSLGLCDGS